MKKVYLFFLLVTLCQISQAQEIIVVNKPDAGNETQTNILPEFEGGAIKFTKFISANYRTPKEFKGSGTLFLTFVVEEDGSLTDIKVIKDLGAGTGKEAIRVLKNLLNGNLAL